MTTVAMPTARVLAAVALWVLAAVVVLPASTAVAQDHGDVLAELLGKWTLEDDETGDLSLSEITVEQDGNGLIIEANGAGGTVRTVFEPADDGDFLRAAGSGGNPLKGKPAHWVRLDGDGLHVHRMESTRSGGIDIVTEEIFITAGEPGVMRYRRLAFSDGVSTGISSGTFNKGG